VSTPSLEGILRESPLAGLAWRAAQQAGIFLLDERPANLRVGTKSSPTDPVTEMDQGAERIIVTSISAERPHDGFLGEEGADDPGSTGVRWIIDPLDGTVNYIYGIPIWAVSIGVEIDGVLECGVVNIPAQREAFVGIRGEGSWHVRGDVIARISPSWAKTLDMALIGTGFGYKPEQRAIQTALMASLAPRVRDVRRFGACAVDLCWLALGRLDMYYEDGVQPWDFAAGAVIAREAGCLVTSLESDEPSSDMLLAGPPSLHQEMRSHMRMSLQSMGRSSAAYE
jgi:myo-inositol-1(or 4)-monophosphatase